MYFAKIPYHHVAYLRTNKSDALPYLLTDEVKRPQGIFSRFFGRKKSAPSRPADWPMSEAERILIDPDMGTTARAMHFFLNGTDAPVEGPGNIFQAWITAYERSAVKISSRHGYVFIHESENVAALLCLLETLDSVTLSSRWRKVNEALSLPNDELEYEYIAECFSRLKTCYKTASSEEACVIWAPEQ